MQRLPQEEEEEEQEEEGGESAKEVAWKWRREKTSKSHNEMISPPRLLPSKPNLKVKR